MPSNDAHNAWKKGQPLDKANCYTTKAQENNNNGKTQKEKGKKERKQENRNCMAYLNK
jgi:hypothetical protein